MKKLSILTAVLAIAGIFLLQSCDPVGTVTPPLLAVNPTGELTAGPSDEVNYEVIVTSETDLQKVEISGKIGEVMIMSTDTIFEAGVLSATFNFTFEVPATANAGDIINVDFTAFNEGETTVVTRNVTVEAGEIATYTAVIMSDLENPVGSSFYAIPTNELMTLNQAIATPEKVDIIYYYGVTNKAVICSPMDEGVKAFTDLQGRVIVDRLTTKNDTRMATVDMTTTEFAAVSNDGPIVANKPAVTSTAVTKLEKDNVFHVQTVSGKQALVMVKNIVGTQGTSMITIEVKVQI